MIVEPQFEKFASLALDGGETLTDLTVAYETYGALDTQRKNAILILHAFSGDAHAAGISHEGKPGWWDNMIGPGKAFDTDKYFVICSNVLGGCRGTTGPASHQPGDRLPLRHVLPGDHHRRHGAAAEDADRPPGHRSGCWPSPAARWAACRRCEWAVAYPESVACRHPHRHHGPPQRAADRFQRGGPPGHHGRPGLERAATTTARNRPARGLAVARMVGHITYMSDDSMREKFGRRLRDKENFGFDFDVDFEVESYLRYRGSQFVDRFDANSYLYITKAMDYFDLANGNGVAGRGARRRPSRASW